MDLYAIPTTIEGSILLVDDQPEQIDIIKSALEQHFVVKVVIRWESVFRVFRSGAIDLILLDVVMPGMSGYEICRQLKSHAATREIPVIFLTNRNSQNDEAVGLKLGAMDFIRKPSSPAVVLARCRNAIVLQRTREDLRRKEAEIQQLLQNQQQVTPIPTANGVPIAQDNRQGALAKTIDLPTHF